MVDWANFLREECENCLELNSGETGKIDNIGKAIVVEIDEIKYF